MKDKCNDCTNSKGCVNCEDGNMYEKMSSAFENFAKEYMEENDAYIVSFYDRYAGLVDGVRWQKVNLWKDAQGDDLPEIDREVIVFTQTERQYPKVAIAHTMPLGDWKQFDGNRYYLERNGEVGWSLPDVKIWLDCNLPLKEGGEE